MNAIFVCRDDCYLCSEITLGDIVNAVFNSAVATHVMDYSAAGNNYAVTALLDTLEMRVYPV